MREVFRAVFICFSALTLIFILTGLRLYEFRKEIPKARSIKCMVHPGADDTGQYIQYLKGKRVAVVASPASLIAETPLVDSLIKLGSYLSLKLSKLN